LFALDGTLQSLPRGAADPATRCRRSAASNQPEELHGIAEFILDELASRSGE
jgi:hypothetical protein